MGGKAEPGAPAFGTSFAALHRAPPRKDQGAGMAAPAVPESTDCAAVARQDWPWHPGIKTLDVRRLTVVIENGVERAATEL